jgi:L-fucose isomerase-like protein
MRSLCVGRCTLDRVRLGAHTGLGYVTAEGQGPASKRKKVIMPNPEEWAAEQLKNALPRSEDWARRVARIYCLDIGDSDDGAQDSEP